jgi:dTDP-4-amino-4,6-dideoxygalactose transaminase
MTIPFNIPYVAGRELEYIQQVIASRAFAGNNAFTRRVQALLEARTRTRHALLTHSCTAALEMSALLLDLGPGDEVVMPSYTFCATASAFLRTGARPVFCEVDPATMMIDVADAARRVTPRTRAIVPVHYAGIAADMDAVAALAAAKGLAVVEDAAQGYESSLRGVPLGTLSRLGCLSFHETKNLHCGLGGALLINDPALLDRAEAVWERGTNRAKKLKGLVDKYTWIELGSSFYPTELQAAFLLAQLEAAGDNLAIRKRIHDGYMEGLAPVFARGLLRPLAIGPDRVINYHALPLILNSIAEGDALREYLVKRGIQAFIGYVPLHSSPMGHKLGYRTEDLPLTEEYAQRVLRMPFHHGLSPADVAGVCAAVAAHFKVAP